MTEKYKLPPEAAKQIEAFVMSGITPLINTLVSKRLKLAAEFMIAEWDKQEKPATSKVTSNLEWEANVLHQELDKLGVPRGDSEDLYTLWGRVKKAL